VRWPIAVTFGMMMRHMTAEVAALSLPIKTKIVPSKIRIPASTPLAFRQLAFRNGARYLNSETNSASDEFV